MTTAGTDTRWMLGPARLEPLDGLRGTAAVIVVSFHVLHYVTLSDSARSLWLASPLGVLVNGTAAVHLFFLLSGYVLSLTLARDLGPPGLARYYVRRVFRIQPPYMAAVVFAWVASIGYARLGSHSLTAVLGCIHIPSPLLPRALAFPSAAFGQLSVGWSLYVELAVSAVFPLIFWSGRRVHALVPVLASLGSLFLLTPFPAGMGFLIFALDFALGTLLYLERDRAERWCGRLPTAGVALLGVAVVVLWQLPHTVSVLQTGTTPFDPGHTRLELLSMGFGCALLLVGALHLPAWRRLFSSRPAVFFGRISYSLYLVHLTLLLLWFCRMAHAQTPLWTAVPLFVGLLAVSTAVALAGFHFVELPSIRAGRALIRAGEVLTRRRAVIDEP